MRSFHPRSAILATIVFLAVANVILLAVVPEGGKVENDPGEEIWFVYFAVVFAGPPPQDAGDAWLREALIRLDEDAQDVASRLRVLGCEHDEDGFSLRIEHLGSGKTYTVGRYGVQ